MTLFLALAAALAAPPSSQLTGPEGELSWTLTEHGATVDIVGKSPSWTVTHQAHADLTPLRTERTDSDGTFVVVYEPGKATCYRDGTLVRTHEAADLWDGDTVDVRLGQATAAGARELRFSIIDPASGKLYGMKSYVTGEGTCSGTPCTRVELKLSGWMSPFGPTWSYGFDAKGRLLSFAGPIGTFAARGG